MILLSRVYGAYLAGAIVQLPTSTEAALVAQNLATVNAGPVTAGAVNAGNEVQGRVSFAAGAASLVVSNNNVTTESKVFAVIAQAAADGTALYVARIVCGAGFFTVYLNAAATANTVVDWALFCPTGLTPKN
jgi:hypothetical protein